MVDCTPDVPNSERKGIETVKMPVADGNGDDEMAGMTEQLPREVHAITDILKGGNGEVLVTSNRDRHQ